MVHEAEKSNIIPKFRIKRIDVIGTMVLIISVFTYFIKTSVNISDNLYQ
jgi:hypothetical protein